MKLLNFTKGGIKYGVFFMEPVDPEKEGCPTYRRVVSTPMDLGSIANRVYLGLYREFGLFWNDVGLVFRNCRTFNPDPRNDIRKLCDTLRECSIQLYRNWHTAMTEKYRVLKEKVHVTDQKLLTVLESYNTSDKSLPITHFINQVLGIMVTSNVP